ncbi:MAG: PilZ domain-containing protein [Candidatus Zixiibacteriota bacterium]
MGLTRTQANNLTVQVWEKLHLAVGEPGKEGVYACRVTDIHKDKLVISRPEFQYGDSLLANNRVISARFTRADAAYSFKARLIEAENKKEDTMYLVELGKIERLQRRRFVRLDLVYPIKYKLMQKPLEETVELKGRGFFQARTLNISSGGTLVQSESELKVNQIILMDFLDCKLENLPRYVLAICRQTRLDDNQNYLAGFEFMLEENLHKHFSHENLKMIPAVARMYDDRMQNALVTELFTEQLLMRKKGIL